MTVPNETDRFPGTKPRALPVVKKEDAPREPNVKIRMTPQRKEEKKIKNEENEISAEMSALCLSVGAPLLCLRCGSRTHEELKCTSKVLQERVLECSVLGHGMYIFGKTEGCPKCS